MAQITNAHDESDESSLKMKEAVIDLENRDKREDQQRRMAWVAMLSMVVLTTTLFTPLISIERLTVLTDLISMFYIAQAGVVATFFGSQAYISGSGK